MRCLLLILLLLCGMPGFSVQGEGIEEVEISTPRQEQSVEPAQKQPSLSRERPIPFQNVVADVDPAGATLTIGKRKKRLLFVRAQSRLRHPDGSPATLADIQPGMIVRGSYRKLGPSEGEIVSLTIGTKADAQQVKGEE